MTSDRLLHAYIHLRTQARARAGFPSSSSHWTMPTVIFYSLDMLLPSLDMLLPSARGPILVARAATRNKHGHEFARRHGLKRPTCRHGSPSLSMMSAVQSTYEIHGIHMVLCLAVVKSTISNITDDALAHVVPACYVWHSELGTMYST